MSKCVVIYGHSCRQAWSKRRFFSSCGTETDTPEKFAETPAQVSKLPELEAWQLYLVDWGYNTAAERERAAISPRIQLLSLGDDFAHATGTAA